MNVYVYQHVSEVSDSYHCGGGLVIVAAKKPTTFSFRTYDKEERTVDLPEPSGVYPTFPDINAATYVFPDAGCC